MNQQDIAEFKEDCLRQIEKMERIHQLQMERIQKNLDYINQTVNSAFEAMEKALASHPLIDKPKSGEEP